MTTLPVASKWALPEFFSVASVYSHGDSRITSVVVLAIFSLRPFLRICS